MSALIVESDTRAGGATLYSYFEYDALNHMTAHKTKANLVAGFASWWWTKRSHYYDATGRLVKSNHKTWQDGQQEPGGNTLEHVYAGSSHVQNYDGTNYGAVWHWAGAQHEHMGPLASPNSDTASQTGYNIAAGGADESGGGGAGGMTPQKRTFINPTTEGDQRHLFGQGRPMAKDSSGNGANWYQGTTSQRTGMSGYPVESRLMFEGTVSSTDMSRATDAREKDRIGIFGTGLSYAGSYGRVTSESIGRDLNPLGRGTGEALVGGDTNLGSISPGYTSFCPKFGNGNSVNNLTIHGPVIVLPQIDRSGFVNTYCYTCCHIPYRACLTQFQNNPCDCNIIAYDYSQHCCGAHKSWSFSDCVTRQCDDLLCLPERCVTSITSNKRGCPPHGDAQLKQSNLLGCGCNENPNIFHGMELSQTRTQCRTRIIIGDSCHSLSQATLANIIAGVIDALNDLMYCKGRNCLPDNIKSCLWDLCYGIQSIRLECNSLFGCIGNLGFFKNGKLHICPRAHNSGNQGIKSVAAHELLHGCDQAIGKANHHMQRSDNLCESKGGFGSNPLNEGFAEACTNACIDNNQFPGVMARSVMTDCCRCRVCAQ